MKKAIIAVLVLTLNCRCTNILLKNSHSFRTNDSLLILDNWRIIGPFVNKNTFIDSSTVDDYDFAQNTSFGTESMINDDNYKEVIESYKELNLDSASSAVSETVKMMTEVDHFDFSREYQPDAKLPYSVYAITNIDSDSEKEIYIMSNICQTGRIWLNGTLIQEYEYQRNMSGKKFRKYSYCKLKKGKNTLLVKSNLFDYMTVKSLYHWKMVIGIATPKIAEKYFWDDYKYDFIKNRLESADTMISIYFPLKHIEKSILKIYNLSNDSLIKTYKFNRTNNEYLIIDSLQKLDKKLYKISLQNTTTNTGFFLNHNIKEYYHLIKSNKNIPKTYKDRLRYRLFEVNYSKKCDLDFYMLTILENIINIESTLYNIEFNTLKILSYKSSIDNSTQYFVYYKPQKCAKRPPLVVKYPITNNSYTEANKSFYYDNTTQLKWDAYLAEKFDMAIVWPYLKGYGAGDFIGETDFFDMMKVLKKEIDYDEDRVYLMGECSGGTNALKLLGHNPDFFAGIGVASAFVNLNNRIDKIDKNIHPLELIKNASNIPFYLYHSINDEQVDIKESESLLLELYKNKIVEKHFFNKEGASHLFSPKDYFIKGYEYLSTQKRNRYPKEIHFTSLDSYKDSIYYLNFQRLNLFTPININTTLIGDNFHIDCKNITIIYVNKERFNFKKELKVLCNSNVEVEQTNKMLKIKFIDNVRNNQIDSMSINRFLSQKFLVARDTFELYKQFNKYYESTFFSSPPTIKLNSRIALKENIIEFRIDSNAFKKVNDTTYLIDRNKKIIGKGLCYVTTSSVPNSNRHKMIFYTTSAKDFIIPKKFGIGAFYPDYIYSIHDKD